MCKEDTWSSPPSTTGRGVLVIVLNAPYLPGWKSTQPPQTKKQNQVEIPGAPETEHAAV